MAINLPALAEENDPLGRKEGEALWPEMSDEEALLRKKKAGIRTGGVPCIRAARRRLRVAFKARVDAQALQGSADDAARCQAVDAACKTGVGNDYQCHCDMGHRWHRLLPAGSWRRAVEFPDLKRSYI